MKYTVTFANVGREKATFSVDVGKVSYATLTKAVRKHLASRDIGIIFDGGDKRTGFVCVGMGRVVGEFTWSETT